MEAKSVPSTLSVSRDGDKFATFSFPDRQVRIFAFRTGKCLRRYDESIPSITAHQQSTSSPLKLDTMTFGSRLAADRELEKSTSALSSTAVIFDESGNFVVYGTLAGIKVVNIVTNRMVRLFGKEENARFTGLAMYQGAPKKKEVTNLAMAASENPLLHDSERIDPILFATAFRKARFYLFTMEEYAPI
jgi:peptidylprolyl isomerase domain and WD repeat-containing protein 1